MSLKQSPPYLAARLLWRRFGRPLLLEPTLQYAEPGHFYSPLPDLRDVKARRADLFENPATEVPGVNLRADQQLGLVRQISALMPAPFQRIPATVQRYGYENSYFGYADATALYGILCLFTPKRIIEVGSGWSSAAMLDTIDRNQTGAHVTFIEPYPERLKERLKVTDDRHTLLTQSVQSVPLETFDALEANDILFIDSSHVAKIGSDVVHLLGKVLPRLKPGVLVHVHDIFWPFDYPEDWVSEGRAWNESYMLRSFLQYNTSFEIVLWISHLRACYKAALESTLPIALRDHGGSIWLRKTRS